MGVERMGNFIDQKANFSADFGYIFRSSAIFAILPEARLTLSILDYWRLKNGVEISLVATVRSSAGELISRELLEIENKSVINFAPRIDEGSVEIEAFANRNLRIPYAAVIGVYETPSSISMVHSYGRNHAPSEIEEGRAVLSAREACISLRRGRGVRTRAFFHNGDIGYPAQTAKLIITRESGAERSYRFALSAMAPYETVAFEVRKLAPDYEEFLGDERGWAALQFENASAFPRMLVCWDDPERGALQVTHSNFDYSEHETDCLAEGESALMVVPALGESSGAVVIYPRCAPAHYQVEIAGERYATEGGELMAAPAPEQGALRFTSSSGPMPSRLVTAVRGPTSEGTLPFECSLGVFHSKRPPKRFHWGVVSARLKSTIYFTTYEGLYGEPDQVSLEVQLHGAAGECRTAQLNFPSLGEMPRSFPLDTLFPDAPEILGEDFGYVTIRSSWGGFIVFTSLAKGSSLSVEHSF